MSTHVLISTFRVSRATVSKLRACMPSAELTSLPPARAAVQYNAVVVGAAYGARDALRIRWPQRGIKPLTVSHAAAAEVAARLISLP